jgi:moderate conductance mechanosensitive channel
MVIGIWLEPPSNSPQLRTIRLRDQAGTAHSVPFGEVTTVKNLTRDFAYAVARI